MPWEEIIIRLLVSSVYGGLIGFEREISLKTAGLRTNILICMGATLITIVSIIVSTEAGNNVSDPGRIAAQIVTGIGFLGAGAIVKERFSIMGVTTAASIWLTAGIGMAVGAGQFFLGGASVFITLAVLISSVKIEDYFRSRHKNLNYHIKFRKDHSTENIISDFYRSSIFIYGDIKLEIHEDFANVSFSAKNTPGQHKDFQQKMESSSTVLEFMKF